MKRLSSILFLFFLCDFSFAGFSSLDIGFSYNYFKSTDFKGYNTSFPVIGVSICDYNDPFSWRVNIRGGYKNIDPIMPSDYVKEKAYFVGGGLDIGYMIDFQYFIFFSYVGIDYKQTEVKLRFSLLDDFYYGYKGYRLISVPFSFVVLRFIDFWLFGIEIDVNFLKIYSTHYNELLSSITSYTTYERYYLGGYSDRSVNFFIKLGIRY